MQCFNMFATKIQGNSCYFCKEHLLTNVKIKSKIVYTARSQSLFYFVNLNAKLVRLKILPSHLVFTSFIPRLVTD